MGMGTSVSTAVSERIAVVIDDYMFDASTAGELKPEESPKDFHDTWDLDGTDFTPEASPGDEGYWDDFENIVLNGNYQELGSDLVTNGTFDSDANWTKADSWSIAGGKASSDGSQSSNAELVQQNGVGGVTLNIVNGKTYELTLDVVVQAGAITQVEVGGTYATDDMTSSGTYTRTITASSTNKRLTITANPTFEGSVDNVTLKQVDPNDRWTLGTGWTIEDSKAVATSAVNSNLVAAASISIGNTYEVRFTVSDYSGSGTVKPMLGTVGAVSGTTVNANGTYTENLVADANQSTIAFRAGGTAFTGKIDDVSVKEYAITPLDV